MDIKKLQLIWKGFLLDLGKNETKIAEEIGQTQQNLNRKIKNGTIRFLEFSEILEKYGYTIDIRQKDK